MRAYVITMMSLPKSVVIAGRCVNSGAEHGLGVSCWPAKTPQGNPEATMKSLGWSTEGFKNNKYSRYLPCLSAFISHSSIWRNIVEQGEGCVIMEHDAVVIAPIPVVCQDALICNLGRPSFGSFATPEYGLGDLKSKPYFPGAHGYWVSPDGAQLLLHKAEKEACPTDVFLHLDRFSWLQEYYPWPIVARDSWSSIQREAGCVAKHNDVRPL